jgi:glycosyltransferase involved in cell wall biosynthesis
LSLVIPTYNRADLIGPTLDSALNQSQAFFEVIVVDDGSSDYTQTVLENYAGRIQNIRTSNRGVQAARNTGVAAARSKYVALCDSDDILEADFVASILPWLNAHPQYDILYSNFVTFDEHTTYPDKFSLAPEGFFDGATVDEEFLSNVPELYVRTVTFQPLFSTGITFQKSFFEKLGGYNPAFNKIGAEDWEFTLRAIGDGNVALCTRPLARIRKHAGNASADPIEKSIGEAKILEFALEHHRAAGKHQDFIRNSIRKRRIDAFNASFAKGNFDGAVKILSLLQGKRPSDLKFQVKNIITSLPDPLRRAAWWVIQNR